MIVPSFIAKISIIFLSILLYSHILNFVVVCLIMTIIIIPRIGGLNGCKLDKEVSLLLSF